MPSTITILDPIGLANAEGKLERRTLDRFDGKVIGFIDNTKPNFSYLAEDMGRVLEISYGAKSIVMHRKGGNSMPATPEAIRDLADQCDLVVAGSGD